MSSRIYIGRLSYKANEDDISDFFRGFGRIREILLKNGYGFVEFDDHRDADDAVYELNGKELMGERIQIEIARGRPRPQDSYRDRDRGYSRRDSRGGGGRGDGGRRGGGRDKYGPPTRTDYRLIVENLSSRVSWQDLKDYMRQAGDVTYADAHKQVRNEGTVEFSSYSDMKTALDKLDDTEINGRRIKLVEDKRRSRRRSRSRSHSRSRSRRRSRSPRSRSGSRKRSRSKSRSRSRSKGRGRASKSKSRSRSRSRSPRKRSSRSKSRSRSKSKSKSRSRSRDRDRDRKRSKSASPAPVKERHDDSDKGSDKGGD